MKIEEKTVKKINISGIQGIDPINVFPEDFGGGKGRMTIECFGTSWSYFWPGMGDRTIAQFFCSCDKHYLAGKLSGISHQIIDYDNLDCWLINKVKARRKEKEIDADEARELLSDIAVHVENDEYWLKSSVGLDMCRRVFGDEYWYQYPMISNPQYEYLCRIIDTVKLALAEVNP